MVDIGDKLQQIMEMIFRGDYFTINRARQFGKTTTLHMIARKLPKDYFCVRTTFEGEGDDLFSSEEAFCGGFVRQVADVVGRTDEDYAKMWLDEKVLSFPALKRHLDKVCTGRNVVLLIDEGDANAQSRVFLQFLAMLRSKFLERYEDGVNTFHSVVLAGVYDIKNIRCKLTDDNLRDESKLLSPWNIATDFEVDMSFNPADIATMLADYESDHKTGMDIDLLANEIFHFTNGYPVLVSRICQYIDEAIDKNWTQAGVLEAVKQTTWKKSVLFDDIVKNLENHPDLYDFMYKVVMYSEDRPLSVHDPIIELCLMYNYIRLDDDRRTRVSNIIFGTMLSQYFMSKDETAGRINSRTCGILIQEVTAGGKLNMELVMRKFAMYYEELFTENDTPFLEKHGRLVFLTFLSPLLNGHGFYHIESQLTDLRRMDIVVNFGNEQFIVELKTWRGDIAKEKAYGQLLGYMSTKRADKGYLLTFDFRRDENKVRKAEWVQIGDKQIFDVVV